MNFHAHFADLLCTLLLYIFESNFHNILHVKLHNLFVVAFFINTHIGTHFPIYTWSIKFGHHIAGKGWCIVDVLILQPCLKWSDHFLIEKNGTDRIYHHEIKSTDDKESWRTLLWNRLNGPNPVSLSQDTEYLTVPPSIWVMGALLLLDIGFNSLSLGSRLFWEGSLEWYGDLHVW